MIRAWLELPPAGIFLTLAILYFGVILALRVLFFCPPFKRPIQTLNGIVAPFFGSIAVLFALLTGFLANDISDRTRQSMRAVQTEAGELRNIYTLSVASTPDMSTIREKWKAYADSVVNEEWPAMAHGHLSPSTHAAYDELLKEVSNPAIGKSAGQAVSTALLSAAIRLGTARSERLAAANDHTNDLKWLVVIVLGLITQIAIALVHLERPRAMTAALVVFASAAVITLSLVAFQEYPFYGVFRLSPAPIVETIRVMVG
jgi:hypothetical protein